jgi:hypothetical protein
MEREFDLNIEKVLEHWTLVHALREVIANALDERALTGTKEPEVSRDDAGRVHVRDFGRGLRYEHLTQNESAEKQQRPDEVVGKFGVGLKDALATFDRRRVAATIESAHGVITTAVRPKAGFPDVTTLHAIVEQPSDEGMVGTDFILEGEPVTDDVVHAAKELFLHYAGDEVLDVTAYGQILRKAGPEGRIYVNGLRVAEEEDFLFSYNITSTTKALRQALNRERSHVGRSAYTDRVKSILLASEASDVAEALVADMRTFEKGTQHDETKWIDIAVHACQQLNASKPVIFLTAAEQRNAADLLSHAIEDGYEPITVPDNVRSRLSKVKDAKGNPMRDLDRYAKEWSESFEFQFVEPNDLRPDERAIWDRLDLIFTSIGGRPKQIKDVLISETMRMQRGRHFEAVGVWEESEGSIVVRRDQLRSAEAFAGTVLHETAHAISGALDISLEFEIALTDLLGEAAAHVVKQTDEET